MRAFGTFSRIPWRSWNRFYTTGIPNLDSALKLHDIHPALLKRADHLKQELSELETTLSSGATFKVEDSKKFSELSSIIGIYDEYLDQKQNYTDLVLLLADQSLKQDALEELSTSSLPQLTQTINKLSTKLLPPHEFYDKPCIVELRPGVGGSEATIFANDLLQMYLKYCQLHKWQHEILSISKNESGSGISEASLLINEPFSYNRLRFEAGVHRVQRVPETEVKGRTHTSTAAVVVLPKIDDDAGSIEREFKRDELRIDVMRASGSGGQHVNTTESAVRITHIPTNIVVLIQDERSQHKNKAKLLTILKSRLMERERLERLENANKMKKSQVTTTDRSDKIRTYNFSQNRITDHRCGLTLYDLEGCMNGERLDEIMDAVEQKETEDRSKELIEELESVN